MIRVVRFLLPWGLMLFGCALLYKGLNILSMDVETEATPVSITAIEEGSLPDAGWLEISDGFFYWPAGRLHASTLEYEDGNQEIEEELGYYVPLVSLPVAMEWAAQKQEHRAFEKCGVLVYLPTWLMEQDHQNVLDGKLNLPFEPATVNGTRKRIRQLDDTPRHAFFSGAQAMDRNRAIFVKSGFRPMQKHEAAAMAKMGGWMAGPGLLWIVWRRIQRKRRKVRAELLGAETASFNDAYGIPPVPTAETEKDAPALVGTTSQDTRA